MNKNQRDFIGYQIFMNSGIGNNSGGSGMGCGTFMIILILLCIVGAC